MKIKHSILSFYLSRFSTDKLHLHFLILYKIYILLYSTTSVILLVHAFLLKDTKIYITLFSVINYHSKKAHFKH